MGTGGKIKLEEGTAGGTYVGFKAPDTEVTSELLWELPATDGTAGQVMATNGTKQLYWGNFAEATATANADSSLQAAINSEITNRTVADSSLQAALLVETTSRTVADSSLQAALLVETRNMIINGGFDMWQRGTTASNPGTSGGPAFLADRFWTLWDSSAGTMATSRQTLTQAEKTTIGGGSKYFFRWDQTVGYASNSYRVYGTYLEGVSQIHGKPTTFSFWAKAASNISVTARINASPGSGGTGGLGWTLIGTANLTTTWQKFSFTLPVIDMSTWVIPNENTSSVTIGLWLPAALSTFTLDTTCWMLNEGNTAAAFRRAGGSIGGELALCQRYYEKSYAVETAPGSPSVYAGIFYYQHFNTSIPHDWRMAGPSYKVTKRAIISPTIYSFTGALFRCTDVTTEADFGANSAQAIPASESGFGWRQFSGVPATLGAAQKVSFHWTADAEF
jgi:hypothetical protein